MSTQSARARRERYVGEWLPEPVPEGTDWVGGRPGGIAADPADRVTLDESVGMAFLVVLESMTPAERVARYYAELAAQAPGNATLLERVVNGQPGLVGQFDGVTVTVMAFDIVDDRIRHIWVVRNPDKLQPRQAPTPTSSDPARAVPPYPPGPLVRGRTWRTRPGGDG